MIKINSILYTSCNMITYFNYYFRHFLKTNYKIENHHDSIKKAKVFSIHIVNLGLLFYIQINFSLTVK